MTIEHKKHLRGVFYLLHNKKRAVHNIAVYCKERYAEKSVKRNHVVRFLRKRISEFKLKEAKSSPRHGARILLRKTRRLNPLLAMGLGFCFAKQGGLK